MKKLLTIIALMVSLAVTSFSAVTFTSKVHEGSGADTSSYATASWAPTANQPVWMMVTTGLTSGVPAIPTVSGNGMTWVQIATGTTATTRRATWFYASGVGSPTTEATTITIGETSIFCMVDIVELNGASNTEPIKQFKVGTWTSQNSDTGVTLDNGFSDTGNATLGGVYYNSATGGITPGTGFTELVAETSITSPNCQQEIEWRVDNDTSVNWTIAGAASNKLGAGFEIQIAGSAPSPPPSTVTTNHLTADFSDVQQSSYTTASITPVANEPTFIVVGARKATATTQPTITGNSITWTLVTSQVEFTTGRSLYLFKGISATPTTGTIVINFVTNHLSAYWSVDGLTGADTTTPNVQSATNAAFAQSLTVTLGAFSNAGNATYGATFWNSTTAITEGSGFTEVVEKNGLAGLQVEFKSTNDTSVDWSYAGGTNRNVAGIAVEVQLGVTTGTPAQWFFLSNQRRRSE